jgi:uncharacterized delta-60 repeat protein
MRIHNFLSALFAISLGTTVAIAQPTNPGANDYSFDPGSGATGGSDIAIHAIAVQNDGKIIIGGNFLQFNGAFVNNVIRLNSNGSRDESFSSGWGEQGTSGVGSSAVRTITIQSDGKIIIGGDFLSYGNEPSMYIARLGPGIVIDNGTLDETFMSTVNSPVTASAIQGDGKIIVGGGFHPIRIGRINLDGSSDGTFNPGTGVTNTIVPSEVSVNALAIQSDGKILIGGQFNSYNGTSVNHIARLNANGTLDGTFDIGSGADYRVYAIAVQPNGKIIVGGEFTTFNGTTANHIVRLNADGSIDGAFVSGTGANDRIRTLAVQGDGKIIIGGRFTSYDGISAIGIARLNANGSIDETFSGSVQNSDGSSLTVGEALVTALQNDGKILTGGSFRFCGSANRSRIARVLSAIGTAVEDNHLTNISIGIYPNPNSGFCTLHLPSIQGQLRYEVLSPIGQLVQNGSVTSENTAIDLKGVSPGLYTLRVQDSFGQQIGVRQVILQ